MHYIIELINLISSHNPTSTQILGGQIRKQSKQFLLYNGIKTGQIKSDKEAMVLLFDSSAHPSSYYKIKSKLKNNLVNSLFNLSYNSSQFTDFQKAYYGCYKNWAVVRILFGRSAKKSAVQLAKTTLARAIKFEFTELVVNLTRVLRLHYATTEGSLKKFTYYNKLLLKHSDILLAELRAEQYYEELLIEFVKSKANKKKLGKKVKAYVKELEQYSNHIESYNFLFFYYTLSVLQYEIINNHKFVIIECLKVIDIFRNKPYNIKSQIYGFASKAFSTYIKLGDYINAKKISEVCIKTIETGTPNWFKFHQLYYILFIHTKQFHKAVEIINLILSHPNLSFQNQDTQETWKIYQAYTYILSITNKIQDEKSQGSFVKKFKLRKFLNEVPAFSKDKKGANIHILIIQIIILLIQEKYGQIIDRILALERYSRRYLKKESETFRSDCFINMLICIPIGNFHKLGIQRHAKKYIQKLNTVPLKKANQPSEFEIIPYEYLWLLILELCAGN